MSGAVLALDQGTTGSTAIVLAADGRVLAKSYSEFAQHFPEPGWVEHDALEIWEVTLRVARDALSQSGVVPEAVGITNQRETVVVWDRATGEPVHRAIVWQDRRTAARCRQLEQELGVEFLSKKTGLTWDPYFSATKIEWLFKEVDGLAARAADGDVLVGTVDSWLIWKLSGGAVHVTDHTNASRTMLYNLESGEWDPELLDIFGVPAACLPEIVNSSGVVALAGAEYLGDEIPIAGVAGDQQAALFGQGCWEPGHAKCTYGTGAFLLYPLGDSEGPGPGAGMLTTVACHSDGTPMRAIEGSVFIAGAAIQWLRDGLQLIESAAETEAMAANLTDNGGVFFVPALVGLGAPHWESRARGTIVGLTRGTTREHIVRAALEAMAYGTRELIGAAGGGCGLVELKVDGGATANDWLMRFLADTTGVVVRRPDVVETTALGAAGLAGIATGVWENAQNFAESRVWDEFEPGNGEQTDFAGWQRAVAAAVYWARSEF